MKFKAYYTNKLSDVATQIFNNNDVEVKVASALDEETYIRELKEYQPDVIMCRTEPVTAAMMDVCQNLKGVGKQGAGLDNIDIDHATSKKIQVVYAPAGNANAVAEHAVMLMLMTARRFSYVNDQFRKGNFYVRMGLENTVEVEGKTLGLVGCGRISKLFAAKCINGLGMKVVGYDPYVTKEQLGGLPIELKDSADEIWKTADFVSIHLPLMPSTERTVGMEQFKMMKPRAIFLNVARGGLIREEELVEALKTGVLFGAGLDVYEPEPLCENSRQMMDMDNVVLTPHTAASTEQSVINCCTSCATDLVNVCYGRPVVCPVNKI
ncbi:hydroxyacid dehydrogenase [Oscillibacter ruminantium]|jgi:D-3-phosphoglycerate dehydrogenase|uniref:hydroxyacid dehydrogenase n=1 Tax=Oscillibacter ruminantium TaxID=1263547 RepID=UPI0002F7EE19|nr:hydroxyacid dehydrogenase [Oscillibacter ruminantium]MDN0031938.1 hydroxyacid dehydrogenase [Oscillibacter valericigenes]MEA5041455.1 hydroxyacid dehydrogenase [Oscillibacter ruminantium]